MAITLTFEFVRGGRSVVRELAVEPGCTVREALRRTGYPPEGCLVLDGDRPLPLDSVVERSTSFTIVATFSGG